MSQKLETAIWKEITNNENEFQAEKSFCYGYDVYNDLIKNANWIDYLYLLISGTKPTDEQSSLLEKLSIILANPGIRDLSVRGAMNAGVGKAPTASVLIAALSVGSGQYSGAREVSLSMQLWLQNYNMPIFDLSIKSPEEKDIWPEIDHLPGFDPHAINSSIIIDNCLEQLSQYQISLHLNWLIQSKTTLEKVANQPLSLIGVISAAFCDLSLTTQQSEFLYLILRLPGAAAHAMEQEKLGWRKFPFFADTVSLEKQPEKKSPPDVNHLIEGYIHGT
jgi:citrate synthase